jgi:biopolymer transport protein ExbB/TolQ
MTVKAAFFPKQRNVTWLLEEKDKMGTVKSLLLVLAIAVDMVVTTCVAASWLSGPGDYLYEMIFHRSFVQYLTLFAFALILTLLGGRVIRCICSKREIHKLHDDRNPNAILDSLLGDIISKTTDALARHGPDAALTQAEQFADQQKETTQQAYETINFLMCLLPALGLFGTMFGLSGAMSAAFAKGSMSKESIGIFVSSLGTALDTTVLAMVCAMVAGAIMWLLTRIEKPLQEQRADLVRRLSGLDRLHRCATPNPPSAGNGQNPDVAKVVRAEVHASVAESMTQVASMFDECLGRLEELARAGAAGSAQSASHDAQVLSGKDLVGTVTSYIDTAAGRIGDQIGAQHAEVVQTIASALNRFADAMEASNVVTTVRAEVRAAMAENMMQTLSRFDGCLGTLENIARTSAERYAQVKSEDGRGFSRTDLAKMMSACLESAVDRLGTLVLGCNRETADTVAATLERFTAEVGDRIPRELVISYNRNGHGNGELSDAD